MTDIEVITDHEEASNRARKYLSEEYKDLINDLKKHIDDGPTAGMLAVLVSALKAYGELYQVREAPGERGKLTELQVSKLIAAAVEAERQRVLEAVRQERQAAISSATSTVQESLRTLSDRSLG